MDRMGIEEGEVIQNSLITRSIENAQKKVEENNFGQRKRLLEYDDVMNSQREVIYKRRRSALYGERLELDVMNMMFEMCMLVASQNRRSFEDFKLAVVGVFGHVPHSISEEVFRKGDTRQIAQLMYQEMYALYMEKTRSLGESAQPVLQSIKNTPGNMFENIVFTITDFQRQMQVVVGIDETIESNGKALTKGIEKLAVLNLIDNSWKEHLRDMDDLKQNVQTASYEQKDPLLIYKFKALELFRDMIGTVNNDVTKFLCHYVIPQDEAPREAVNLTQAPQPQYIESHDGIEGEYAEHEKDDVAPVKQAPVRRAVMPNRNDKVSVRYPNGEVKRDVKFKTVEEDVVSNRCILID
jgi:preprotein translocase subunit SecA